MTDILDAYTFTGVTTNFGLLTQLKPYIGNDPATMTRLVITASFFDAAFAQSTY